LMLDEAEASWRNCYNHHFLEQNLWWFNSKIQRHMHIVKKMHKHAKKRIIATCVEFSLILYILFLAPGIQ
jgi:hypothetical protein